VIGRGAFVDAGVVVGDHCKIQNEALIYAPAVLEDGVFVGPAVVLTNDRFPRAINPDGSAKSATDWTSAGVHVETGASLGASSTVIGGVRVGRWALVAAGSVVTRDVAAYALVAGAPARRIGWVGPAGHPLEFRDEAWWCPSTGARFIDRDGTLDPA
jgi:acetyltransferase-like isoleucine patch superfamily enzyme